MRSRDRCKHKTDLVGPLDLVFLRKTSAVRAFLLTGRGISSCFHLSLPGVRIGWVNGSHLTSCIVSARQNSCIPTRIPWRSELHLQKGTSGSVWRKKILVVSLSGPLIYLISLVKWYGHQRLQIHKNSQAQKFIGLAPSFPFFLLYQQLALKSSILWGWVLYSAINKLCGLKSSGLQFSPVKWGQLYFIRLMGKAK